MCAILSKVLIRDFRCKIIAHQMDRGFFAIFFKLKSIALN